MGFVQRIDITGHFFSFCVVGDNQINRILVVGE
nr:MAG TPA: hypothetical protein [Caudoviricetes sp.]DAG86427.1 MAG TPA: hypothetical protein [Caudoviricetes sp.]DAH04481.1 MAG TPA: hypothetical protein [Caudoviricetes sp.]DAM68310.1 MAG TPA: hypothetical protein [Caudoviricetes sp.]